MPRRSKTPPPERAVESSSARPAPVIAKPLHWRPHLIPLAVLWGLALLAYCNSFRSGLVFDNRFVIAQDPRIRQATSSNLHLIFSRDYWFQSSTSSLYRPLTTLSYLFNYAILGNGDGPAGYHWINLFLHAVNIGLVYALGLLLLGEIAPAFVMAAIWAVHPVLTESVTNIVGRADLLAAFGVLAGLLFYARAVASTGSRAIRWQLGVMAAAAIGIFSKESGIVVLAAVFLYDIAYCRELPLRSRLPGYVAMAVPIAAFLAIRQSIIANMPVAETAFTDNPLVGADFWTSRLTAIKVLGKYMWLLIWPHKLSADYSFNQIPLFGWSASFEDLKAILALLICLAAAVLGVICYRRSRALFFFMGFFFAALAPTANLVMPIGSIMAERFLYLPSIAFAGCVAWLWWNFEQRIPPARLVLRAIPAILCLVLAARTFARNNDWFDERSLWTSATEASPNSYKAHQHLASILAGPEVKQLDAARSQIEQALAILAPLPDERNVAAAYTTAGFTYRVQGDAAGPSAAAAWYHKSLDILLQGERIDEAFYRAMSQRNLEVGKVVALTGWSPLYLELGRTYRTLGDYQKALESFDHGRMIDPQPVFFEEMANTYRALNQPAQATVSLLEGITVGSGDQARLAAAVVNSYRESAPQSCALSPSNALNFDCPLVRQQLCEAGRNVAVMYHRMRRDREAAATRAGVIQSLGCPAEMFR